ncbi:MAG: dihydrodipicolinate synthase family protein, partial [Streptosporangiaceae bacterium]
MNNPFRGCGTALVSPFAADLSVDEAAYRRLIRFQIEQGIDFIVPCGTTGETPTLSQAEHLRLLQVAVAEAKAGPRRVPVLGGAGGNATEHVVELARRLEGLGVDGVLSVAPYYNKPTQEGLYQHYKAINYKIGIPIIIYNIPGRSIVDMSVDTMKRLY